MSKYKIAVLGIVALVVVTGCIGGLGGDGDDGANGDDSSENTTVAVAVGLDAEAQEGITGDLNESEQELLQRAQLAPDNLTESEQQRAQEIQGELEQAQQEAVNETNEEFESTVSDSETLSVEDSIEQGGSTLYLVSGSPSEVVGLVNESGVQAITSREQFDTLAEQQQQQQAPGGGGGLSPSP
ncbi:MAG: hypothetical protein ACLFSW_03860 [Halobacteriales archaeon]